MVSAISSQWVSNAKCPASSRRISASGKSCRNAWAPAGRKYGSFLPQMASRGGVACRSGRSFPVNLFYRRECAVSPFSGIDQSAVYESEHYKRHD